MEWYHVLSLVALLVCVLCFVVYGVRLFRLGKPHDYSKPSGSVAKGVLYSNTGAMSPLQKESAYLHLPTYLSGMCYHIGTFLSLAVYIFAIINVFFSVELPQFIRLGISGVVFIASLFGLLLYIKRMFSKKLKKLSTLDDYLSNGFTTLFQLITAFSLLLNDFNVTYFVISSILWLYMPIGKLKHLLYYFWARYQLGLFYGWRNTWPPQKTKH